MPYIPATCPNCKGDLKINSSEEKGYCVHCGSLIDFKEAVKTVKLNGPIELAGYLSLGTLLDNIDKALKSGTNQTIEFRESLYKALELDPENQFLYDMVKSEIWNAKIENNTIIQYNGDSEKVVIPEGITTIATMAFAHAHRLREISLPKSIKMIMEGAFLYETKLTINAYKDTYASKYALASPAKLNIIDIKNDIEKNLIAIEGILREFDAHQKSIKQSLDDYFNKAYSTNWAAVFAILVVPMIIVYIGFSRNILFTGAAILSIAFILITIFVTIFKTGYDEIRCKIAIKKQTQLFFTKSNYILKPLEIEDFKYTKNIFDVDNIDLDLELTKLRRLRNNIINMDMKDIYRKPYIDYSFLDFLKGDKPAVYNNDL